MEDDREIQPENPQGLEPPTLAELDALIADAISAFLPPSRADGWKTTTEIMDDYPGVGPWMVEKILSKMVNDGLLETVKVGRDRYYRKLNHD